MKPRHISKSQRERYLVGDFLEHARIPFREQGIRSAKAGASGPDVKVTCQIAGEPMRIGIEVVEYQVDARPKGGSRGRRISELHRRIWKVLRPRLAADPSIRQCWGSMSFDEECPLEFGSSQEVAAAVQEIVEDLVRFLRDHADAIPETRLREFRREGQEPWDPGDFDGYPVLRKCLAYLLVQRLRGPIGPLYWQYNNAAYVGVVKERVLDLIGSHARKLPSYDRRGTGETWLLICAGVSIPHDSAGREAPARRVLESPELLDAAARSKFDRVVFWERREEWSVWLRPRPVQ